MRNSRGKTGEGRVARIKEAQDLINIAPIEPELYKNESLASLTVYTIYWLHMWELRRTIESIAVLNWRLFPIKFSMIGFPQFPDAFRTNRSLLQCQPKYRNLLTGSAKKGYSLNDRGMQIAERFVKKIGHPNTFDGQVLKIELVQTIPTQEKVARTIDPYKEIEYVRKSRLFDKWKSDIMGERDVIHLHSLLGIFDHTPVIMRQRRLKELTKSAQNIGDEEVEHFLDEVKQNFPTVFVR